MSKIKHNKKRNVGIIYELLVKNMSNFLLEDKRENVNKIKKIIENHFNVNTELFKEYKAYKSLTQKNLSNDSHAVSIMLEAKNIIKSLNVESLARQKSKLIKDINYSFGKGFYYQNLKNYKDLATIQIVINEWKKGINSNTDYIVELEKKVIENMLESKQIMENKKIDSNHSDKLILEIMTKKINEKYKNLSESQKEIIKIYALYGSNEEEKLKDFLSECKNNALKSLTIFENINNNQFLEEKIIEVKNRVKNLDESVITDGNMVKFLTITKLIEELKSEE